MTLASAFLRLYQDQKPRKDRLWLSPQVRVRLAWDKGGLRIPAHDLEEGVWGRLREFLSSPTQLLNALGEIGSRQSQVIQAVPRGTLWYDLLISGQAKSREEIARTNGLSGQHVGRHLQLAWLAPDIVEAILDGHQPKQLTVKRLLAKLPMDWAEQRKVLGFEVKSARN